MATGPRFLSEAFMTICWFLFREFSAADCRGVKLDKFLCMFIFSRLLCAFLKCFLHFVIPSSMTLDAGGGFQFLFFTYNCLMYLESFSIWFSSR